MTVKVSVSLPDDIGAYLATQHNASATVAEALRARMGDAEIRRAKRRADAESYAAYVAAHPVDGMEELDAATAEMSLRGHEW